ncbi:hypothetical protein EOM33_00140 [Candidatus Saccharibacteria bacterium]|nr:hypothetical protein [Candidatus Saccharibacteria bacterium]
MVKKITYYLVAVLMLVGFSIQPVLAIDTIDASVCEEQKKTGQPAAYQDAFNANDGIFFDPCDELVCSTTTGSTGTLTGNDNLEKIYNYFLGKGLTDFQAAGIVGNISQESGGDPTIAQTGGNVTDPSIFGTAVGVGKAWGLIQWDAGGRAIVYAKQAGITGDIAELSTQLDLIWWHLEKETPTYQMEFIKTYKETSSVEEAVVTFHDGVEGAGIPVMENRLAAAQLALETYAQNPSTSVSGSSSSSCSSNLSSGAVAGNAVATAVGFAWPELNGGGRDASTPTDAYKAAWEKNTAIQAGGVTDCGAFVANVMRESGLDPEFPIITTVIWDYLRSSSKYELVSTNGSSGRQPGDIMISSGHVAMWVGEQSGFGGTTAEASLGDHVPWATNIITEGETYRYVGGGSAAVNPIAN